MKKELFILAIFILMPFLSAVSVELPSKINQGETLLATISGSFEQSLTKDNIRFYEGHTRIPMNFEIIKISDKYYLYAQLLGKKEGNYSLAIEGAKYLSSLQEFSTEPILTNFTISNETGDFLISPGFISSRESFDLEISNLKTENLLINIGNKYSSTNSKSLSEILFGSSTESKNQTPQIIKYNFSEINFIPGETKKLNFDLTPINESSLFFLSISSPKTSYQIPIEVLKGTNPLKTIVRNPSLKNFTLDPLELKISAPLNKQLRRTIILRNTGTQDLKEVSLIMEGVFSPYLTIGITEIFFLASGEELEIPLIFESTTPAYIKGNIFAEDKDGETRKLKLILNFTEGVSYNETFISSNLTDKIPIGAKLCSEVPGIKCSNETKCSEKIEWVKDGACCLGTCDPIESNSTKKIIGWLILIVLTSLVIWFFKAKFSKKKRNKIDLEKIAKGKRR